VFGIHKDEHLDALMDLVKGVSEGIVFVTGRCAESVEMHRVRVPEQSLASGERAAFAVQTNRTRILPIRAYMFFRIYAFPNISQPFDDGCTHLG
jgi:hypothetical protein